MARLSFVSSRENLRQQKVPLLFLALVTGKARMLSNLLVSSLNFRLHLSWKVTLSPVPAVTGDIMLSGLSTLVVWVVKLLWLVHLVFPLKSSGTLAGTVHSNRSETWRGGVREVKNVQFNETTMRPRCVVWAFICFFTTRCSSYIQAFNLGCK